MISTAEAMRHVLRWSGLPGYPKNGEGQGELVNALVRASRNAVHAHRITDSMVSLCHYCPTPADVYEVGAQTDNEDERPRAWYCDHCGGTAWQPVYELHTWSGPKKKTERIDRERYEYLLHEVSGAVGEQMVVQAVVRCHHCKLGRDRLLAVETEAHK